MPLTPVGLAWRSVTRNGVRTLSLCLGLASSLFAVIQMDSIASWMQLSASLVLDSVVEDFDIWIVPRDGVFLSKSPVAIVSDGVVGDSIVSVLAAQPRCKCEEMLVGIVDLGGRSTIVTGDTRISNHHASTAHLSRAQISALQGVIGFPLAGVSGHATDIRDEVRLSLADSRRVLGRMSGVSWILCHGHAPSLAATAKDLGILVTDSPVVGRAKHEKAQAIAILLSGHQSRFDPFTFRTKFSALMLHETTTTVFGMLSRAAFLVGLGFCISSFVYQLRERRAEMGCYAALGLTSEVIRLFLAESIMITSISFALASVTSALVLANILPSDVRWNAYREGVLLSLVYLPIVVVLGTLVPAQTVIEESPLRLIRG